MWRRSRKTREERRAERGLYFFITINSRDMSEKLVFKNEEVRKPSFTNLGGMPKELVPTTPIYAFEIHYDDLCFARKKIYFIK